MWKWKRKWKRLEAALFRELEAEAEAEAVMKKLMEAEAKAVKKKINGSGSDKKLPLPDTLVIPIWPMLPRLWASFFGRQTTSSLQTGTISTE